MINWASHPNLVEFVELYNSYQWSMVIQTTGLQRHMYPTMLHTIAPEATGHNEAMCVRYRHQHSLSGAMDFSQVLLPEILFPDVYMPLLSTLKSKVLSNDIGAGQSCAHVQPFECGMFKSWKSSINLISQPVELCWIKSKIQVALEKVLHDQTAKLMFYILQYPEQKQNFCTTHIQLWLSVSPQKEPVFY